MNTIYKFIFSTVFLYLTCTSAEAQTTIAATRDSMSVDSSIRYGQLKNGFTYFIKPISRPNSTLYLNLYNKAGAQQEDPDQMNTAHALEHMAFNGSRNFPSGLSNSKRTAQLGLGMFDYTAGSGQLATSYNFDVPKGNTIAIDLGLLWFKDIISGLKLKEEDINDERGVLRQEYVMRGSADRNTGIAEEKLNSLLFPCINYSDFFEHNENFEPETIWRYYKDWYRPDLTALSIVGNIDDPADLERRIKRSFSKIRPPRNPRELKDCRSGYYKRPQQFHVVERSEDSSAILKDKTVIFKLFFRDPVTNESLYTNKGPQRLILIELLVAAVRERFREGTNHYLSFPLGTKYVSKYRGTPPALEVKMTLDNIEEKPAMEKTIQLLQQIQEYGISSQEWDRIKEKQLNFFNVIDTEDPNYWRNEIRKYYINGEALPTGKHAEVKRWLAHLTLENFNDFIQDFLAKKPEDIGLIVPAGHKGFTEKEVRSWIGNTYRKKEVPYNQPEIPKDLMDADEVEKLSIVGYEDHGTGKSGAREVVLKNGVKVIFKSYTPPPSRSQPRIRLHGFSLKGANCLPKEKYFSAYNAPAIVINAGVNGMDKFEINRFLANTSLRPGGVFPFVGSQETGIQSDAEVKDLETMLQLVYLYFTRPNKDKLAFSDWKNQEYKAYKNPSYNVQRTDFSNAIKKLSGASAEENFFGKRFLLGTIKFEGVEETDFEAAYEAYGQLFGRSNEFTFILSGDFDVKTAMPLVQKYLGNLPNAPKSLSCSPEKEGKNKFPIGPILVEVPAPKYHPYKNWSYGIRFFEKAKDPEDWKEQFKVKALEKIITRKIFDLRFKKGYSLYSQFAQGYLNLDMNRYEIGADLGCVPEELDEIREEVHKIVAEIKAGSISKEYFHQGIQEVYSLYSAKKEERPKVMSRRLYQHYRYQQPWRNPEEVEKFGRSLELRDIVKTANKYLTEENLYEYIRKDD